MKDFRRLLPLLKSKNSIYLAVVLVSLPILIWIFYKLGWQYSLVVIGGITVIVFLLWWMMNQRPRLETQQALLRFRQDLKHRIHILKKLKIPGFLRQQDRQNALPHYLLLGAEGSGKTAFLQQSGIHFPSLNSRDEPSFEAEKGLGFDWWCADHAVLIDVSGSCLADDAKKGRWSLFLKQLRKLSRQYPLDGIMVMVNIETVLASQWKYESALLRARVDSIYQRFGYCLPVQVIFSHCDKISGFDSFFSGLEKNELMQALGFGFSNGEFNEKNLQNKQESLCRQMQQRLFRNLSLLGNVELALEHSLFVEQFIAAQDKVSQFLIDFYKESRYQEQIFLRSIHFTSSENHRAQGYFSHDILLNQLIKSRDYSALTGRQHQKRRWIRQSKRAIMLAVFVLLVFSMVYSFLYNWSLLKQGEHLLKAEQQSIVKSDAQKAAFLKAAADHYRRLTVESKAHGYHRLGMNFSSYQRSTFEKLLTHLLDKDIKQQLYQQLAKDLSDSHQKWLTGSQQQREALRGQYYTNLKLALMLQYPEYFEREFALAMLVLKWKKAMNQNRTLQLSGSVMKSLLGFYLQYQIERHHSTPRELYHFDTAILAQARHDLAGHSVIQNRYAGLVYQIQSEHSTLSFDRLLDDNPLQTLTIDHFYSRDVYQNSLENIFRELAAKDTRQDWVLKRSFQSLGKAESRLNIKRTTQQTQDQNLAVLQRLYFQDRLTAWLNFLEQIRFLQYHSLDDASLQLQALEQKDSFYWQFLNRLHYEFDLSRFVNQTDYQALPAMLVEQWQELAGLTSTDEENSYLMNYIKQLTIIRQDLERISLSNDPSGQSKNYVKKLLANESGTLILEQVTQQLNSMLLQIKYPAIRKSYHSLLLQPVKESYRALLYSAMDSITADWQERIYLDFKDKLSRRFPFHSLGEDAILADFIDFYQPSTGRMDTYIQQDLSVLLDRHGTHFQARGWQGIALPFSSEFLQWLEQQKQISLAVFSGRQSAPVYHFSIYPSPSPGVKEILIASGGKNYPYRNGPQEWVDFQWPGREQLESDSLIRILASNAGQQSIMRYQGNWGIFHLLKAAKLVKHQQGAYLFRWQLGSHAMSLRLRNNAAVDLFEQLLFHPRPLPDKIF